MSTTLTRGWAALLAAGASIALVGCGGGAQPAGTSSPPAETSPAAAVGDPVSGGAIRIGLNSALVCIDPHQNASNTTIFITRNLVDSLTDQDPETGELKPWLATAWTANADATQYTFTLRDDVTFSDGTPLTAQTITKNLDWIKQAGPAVASLANAYLSGYSGSTAVDEHTVQIDFDQPNVQFLQATSTPTLGIFADATTALPADERCQGKLVATGPFTLASYNPQQAIELARRTGYDWGSELRQHTGDAYLETATFNIVPEAGVRTGQLRNGELDLDTIPLTEDVKLFEADANFNVVGRPYPGLGVTLIPNLARPVLQDVKVRQALLLAVNREELVAGVLTQYDGVPTSPLTSSTPLHQVIPGVRFAPDEAKQLLDEAGWVPGADGIREKDGAKLTLSAVYHFSRGSTAAMELVQQQYRAIGVDLQLNLPDPGDLAKYTSSGDFDLWFTPFHRAEADTLRSTLSFYAGNTGRAPEARPVDELLTKGSQETDPAKRQELITQAATELIDQAYAIPLYELAGVFATSGKVQGLVMDATSRLNLYDVWLSA